MGPGTYYEHIVWPVTHGIDLVSALGQDSTIIDGDSTGTVISVSATIDTTTVIRGFTIQRGCGPMGGGIFCVASSPIITGNTITRNTARGGAGILCYQIAAQPIIRGNLITRNSAVWGAQGWGGGIAVWSGAPTITGNTITSNKAYYLGGGIECEGASPTIAHNTISYDTAVYSGGSAGGGGIACGWGGMSRIRGNRITRNRARYGGGVYCRDTACPVIDSCDISNNVIYGLYNDLGASPVLRYNTITDNMWEAVVNVDSTQTVDARYNWWGDSTGPFHPGTNPGGRGDTITDYVAYNPWLRRPVVAICEPVAVGPHVPLLSVNPNPFRDCTVIGFGLEGRAAGARLQVFDAAGRSVRCLDLSSHSQFAVWDGRDDSGRRLASGAYFIRFVSARDQETRKVLLLR